MGGQYKVVPAHVTVADICTRYNYNPETGEVSIKVKAGRYPVGHILDPYSNGRVKGVKFPVSHLAWIIHYKEFPVRLVDHEDGNHSNNRIKNLRQATHQQNQMNKQMPNKHGFKGICFSPKSTANPWMALIRVNGKQTYLGSFPTKEEAHQAYMDAANKHFGEFATNRKSY